MTLPTIHLNGTSRSNLLGDYAGFYEKINEAIALFQTIEFNARDYYVQGEGAFPQAQKERAEIFACLEKARDYAAEHINHIEQ